jgi:type IX secretion system PorP/SprF family membrane protein
MAYAAHFNFNRDDRLSFGIYGGVVQMAYDPSQTITNDIDPEVYNNANFISGDATFGALYKTEDYYFGMSMENLIPAKWDRVGEDSRWRIHTNLNAGYRFKVNENIALLPVLLVKIPPRGPMAADLNVHMDYKNFLSFGLGYRNVDAVMAFFNIRFKDQLTIGYSFDFTTSDIRYASSNTHEVSLRFTTCKVKRAGSADCPLFE